jgi:hypothetical protein
MAKITSSRRKAFPYIYQQFQKEINALVCPCPSDYQGYTDPTYQLDYDLYRSKLKTIYEEFKTAVIAKNELTMHEKAELLYTIISHDCMGGLREIEYKYGKYSVILK